MAHLISAATRSNPRWKTLAVDVREADGRFTRGFVQDLLENGSILVQFDREDDPLQTVAPGVVFQPRWLDEKEDFGKYQDGGRFKVKDKVEVLVRRSPGFRSRWYSGVVHFVNFRGTVVRVEVAKGTTSKGVFGHCKNSNDIQRITPRTLARFAKFFVSFPRGVEVDSVSEEFCAEWSKRARNVVKAIDSEKKELMVLGYEQLRPPIGMFRRIVRDLAEKNRRMRMRMRLVDDGEAEEDEDEAGAAKREKRNRTETEVDGRRLGDSTSSGESKKLKRIRKEMVSGECSDALMIPEMLAAIVRLLDLRDRCVLRGVSPAWKDIIESAPVCRSAHLTEATRPRGLAVVAPCRYFTKLHRDHLSTLTIQCIKKRPEQNIWDENFYLILVFVRSVLFPGLKTVVLHSGQISSWLCLAHVLRIKPAPKIFLKDVLVQTFILGREVLKDTGVLVKSGVLGPFSTESVILKKSVEPELRYSNDDELEKAVILIRNFLTGALDITPLGCPEEAVLTDVAKMLDGRHLKQVRAALKLLNPACFKHEMGFPGTKIILAKSSLRKATLHICKAIRRQYEERGFAKAYE